MGVIIISAVYAGAPSCSADHATDYSDGGDYSGCEYSDGSECPSSTRCASQACCDDEDKLSSFGVTSYGCRDRVDSCGRRRSLLDEDELDFDSLDDIEIEEGSNGGS